MAKKYRLVTSASLVTGVDSDQVKAALEKRGFNPAQVQALLSKKVVVKKELDYQQALELQSQFTQDGLATQIQVIQTESTSVPEPSVFELIEQALATPFNAIAPSAEYQRSLAVMVALSLVAPFIYLCLLLGVCGGLWWFIKTGHHQLFGGFTGYRAIIFSWTVPVIVGVILGLFLLFPLWPRGRAAKPFILDVKKNANFYRAVNLLAQSAGVNPPQFIELMPEVNAAAGPTAGIVSLGQGKFKLMLGLSLVAGSNVQQLMGIIAHEFGHFSQRSAMFAYYWIHSVNRWFGECAYGQDEWDDRLRKWIHASPSFYIELPLLAAHYCLLGVRHLFAVLYKINFRLTQRMSRQMEFDADRYEAQLVGSQQFKSNTLNLRKLATAWQEMVEINRAFLHEYDQLFNNIPAAVNHIANGYSPEFLKHIEQQLSEEQTEFFDSHPADLERINQALATQEKGRLTCTLPAASLLKDFDALCEHVTGYHYYLHGIGGAKKFMVPNKDIFENQNR